MRPVEVMWVDDWSLRVTGPDTTWDMSLESTPATRLLNAAGSLLPERLWRSSAALSAMGRVAGPLLRAGRVRLHFLVPNGQGFKANPFTVWTIAASRATVAGEELGEPGGLPVQAALGDFAIPQRGHLCQRTHPDVCLPTGSTRDRRRHRQSRCGSVPDPRLTPDSVLSWAVRTATHSRRWKRV